MFLRVVKENIGRLWPTFCDLAKLSAQQAVKIPLSSLNGEKMQNLRSALNRVTRERNIPVVTSSDEKYLYVWRADPPENTGAAE